MDSTICRKIESYLLELIQQNSSNPNFKLPSERSLSLMFNASRKPVRNAYLRLSQKGYVSSVHGRGYYISEHQPNTASSLSSRQRIGIALVMPSIRSQYSHDILAGAGDFCTAHKLELSIHVSNNSPEKQEQLLYSVSDSGANGIILFPVDSDGSLHPQLQRLILRKFPLVLIDRMIPNTHTSYIASDNHQAMVSAVEYLYSRGYAHIAYISPPSTTSSTNDARINGFLHGLLRYYKEATPKNILIIDGTPEQQCQTCVQYFQRHPEIEVLIVSGVQRHAVMRSAEQLGLRIPEDRKLMFIDDELPPAERNTLKPMIIKQNGYQIGYQAAQTLYNQIYGDLRPYIRELAVSIINTSEE